MFTFSPIETIVFVVTQRPRYYNSCVIRNRVFFCFINVILHIIKVIIYRGVFFIFITRNIEVISTQQ